MKTQTKKYIDLDSYIYVTLTAFSLRAKFWDRGRVGGWVVSQDLTLFHNTFENDIPFATLLYVIQFSPASVFSYLTVKPSTLKLALSPSNVCWIAMCVNVYCFPNNTCSHELGSPTSEHQIDAAFSLAWCGKILPFKVVELLNWTSVMEPFSSPTGL